MAPGKYHLSTKIINPDSNMTLLYVSEGRKEVQDEMLRWEVK
jgi:hypothetical protein